MKGATMILSAICRAACIAGSMLIGVSAGAAGTGKLQSATGGAVHALIVGIDDYVDVRPKLQGSVGDAQDIGAILRANGVADIRMLLDHDATRSAFVTEMQRLLDVARPGDLAVITYSGHGGTVPEYPQYKGLEPNGKTEEFIMVGYGTSGPATGEVITNKEVKAWLSRLDRKGVDVLFIADSCFGGGMVRGVPDPRVGPPSLRVAREVAPQGASDFQPIPMTPEELRTDVASLEHVTVLSGSDRFTPVPEVFIPSPPTRRGALSYAVARALKGNAAKVGSNITTRRQLFSYARQEVQHYSDDQRIDNSPRPDANDPHMLDRAVFRMMETSSVTPIVAKPTPVMAPCPTVHVAVIHDEANARAGIEGAGGKAIGGVAFMLTDDATKSDLVWDVQAAQVIQSAGDVIASKIGPRQIAGVIQRTAAVQCIKDLTTIRPQPMTLRDGIKRYTPKDSPTLEAQGVSDRYLIVFDVAVDGRIQVVWPEEARHLPMPRPSWTGRPEVIEPFGADYVVAVTSEIEPRDFLDWLNGHDNRLPSVAGQVPGWLRQIQARDATARIGAVALYTASK